MLHQLLNGNGPQSLIDGLDPYTNSHSRITRGTADKKLAVVAHNTDYLTRSFYYDTAKIWNTIPMDIRMIKNRTTFKENLHKYVLILNE